MRLLLLHKLIEPLLEERFRLKFVEGLPTHIARHYLKNDVLLRFHEDQKNIRLNVFDYLWVLLVLMGREIGTPLSLFPTIKEKIDFQDLIFRYLTTRENSIIMVQYPSNDISVGIIDKDHILVEKNGRYTTQSLSATLLSTTLFFPIRELVKQYVIIMIKQNRVDQLKELVLLRDGEVQLIKDYTAGAVKSINGNIIKKIDQVIDLILSSRDRIEYNNKSGETININTPVVRGIIKKNVKNSDNPFYLKKSTEQILTELIKT